MILKFKYSAAGITLMVDNAKALGPLVMKAKEQSERMIKYKKTTNKLQQIQLALEPTMKTLKEWMTSVF